MKFGKPHAGNLDGDFGLDDLPEEERKQFEEFVKAYEEAEPVRLLDVLRDGGYPVKPPGDIGDDALAGEIFRIAEGLSLLNVYLENTDHLSDRQLYEHLWEETLVEPTVIFPKDRRGAWHVDIVGSGSDEDTDIYLRYYADEETRVRWAEDFNIELPPSEKPPFDRDRLLPKRQYFFDEPVEN